MANVGFSNTTLIKKLGLTFQDTVLLINPPINYDLLLEIELDQVKFVKDEKEHASFIHWFVSQKADFLAEFPPLQKRLAKGGMLWVSWPKQSSSFKSDLTESIIRETALTTGMVDIKVCAIDQNWSGLKLVYELINR